MTDSIDDDYKLQFERMKNADSGVLNYYKKMDDDLSKSIQPIQAKIDEISQKYTHDKIAITMNGLLEIQKKLYQFQRQNNFQFFLHTHLLVELYKTKVDEKDKKNIEWIRKYFELK